MRPPARPKLNYEKVAIGEMLSGVIEKVEYDNEHRFKGFQGAEDTVQPAVRLKIKLDGYNFPKYSRWMKFSTGSKSNLYQKYLSKLVEGAQPECDFDLDILNGLPIKSVWSENGDFQNIDAVYPNPLKASANAVIKTIDEEVEFEEPATEF